jgi:hypothetical protein
MWEIIITLSSIVLGVYVIRSTSKKPVMKPFFSITYGDYLVGIGLIICGVINILRIVVQ